MNQYNAIVNFDLDKNVAVVTVRAGKKGPVLNNATPQRSLFQLVSKQESREKAAIRTYKIEQEKNGVLCAYKEPEDSDSDSERSDIIVEDSDSEQQQRSNLLVAQFYKAPHSRNWQVKASGSLSTTEQLSFITVLLQHPETSFPAYIKEVPGTPVQRPVFKTRKRMGIYSNTQPITWSGPSYFPRSSPREPRAAKSRVAKESKSSGGLRDSFQARLSKSTQNSRKREKSAEKRKLSTSDA